MKEFSELEHSDGFHFQVENEYGNTKEPNKTTDKQHLKEIKAMFEDAGLKELFFTSDTPSKGQEYGAIEGGNLSLFLNYYYNFSIIYSVI